MRILVIGGYGFIGSAISGKLIQNKHKVTIIDDLSSGKKNRVKLKHQSLTLDISNGLSEKTFEEDKFEVVIFAANSYDLEEDSFKLRRKPSNMVSLRHALELSYKFKVQRFIFLSSFEVYDLFGSSIQEDAPIVPMSDNARLYDYQEQFCQEYIKKGLNATILRLSNVYGPNLKKTGDSIISTAAYHYKNKEKIQLKNNNMLFQDYIYVTDVAEAVSQTIENVTPSIMNVSSNKELTNNDIIEKLTKDLHSDQSVFIDDVTTNWCYSLSNERIYEHTGWSPSVEVDEGIKKTFSWYLKSKETSENHIQEKNLNATKGISIWKKSFPFLENLVFFVLFMILEIFVLEYMKIHADVFIIYVVFIALFYGLSQGAIAATLASCFYLGIKLFEGSDIAYLLFDLSNISMLIIYVLIGVFIGYAIDKEKYKYEMKSRDFDDISNELDFVKDMYDRSLQIKNALQHDIEHYEDSFGKVFDITDKLAKVNSEEIYNETSKVVVRILKAKSVNILHLDTSGYYARVVSSLGERKYQKSFEISTHPYLNVAINEKRIFVNKKLEPNVPMLVAPIFFEDKVVSLILIDDISFENLSLHYINMLRVVTLLISNAIGQASIYQEAIESQKIYEGTSILKNKYFNEILQIKEQAKEEELSTWSMVKLNLSVEEGIESYHELSKMVRNFDYIGETDNGKIAILFSNAHDDDRSIIIKRFKDKGFKLC